MQTVACYPSYIQPLQSRYVKLADFEYTAYVEVIIYSWAFLLYCFVFQACLCQTWISRNLR